MKQPCELSHIIECEEQYRNQYRNKVEFTVGRRYADNRICVGFNTGNLAKGITYVDEPDGIKTNSAESVWVAKKIESMIIESGIEPYDKKINRGYFRLVLYRESKRTNQVLISLIVSDGYFVEEEKHKWIQEQLISMFAAGTKVANSDLTVVSLSMIYATELSGGYSESDKLVVLSGQPYYEEVLYDYKFRVSPFAFFQVNTSVFTQMLKVVEEFT